MMRMLSPRSVKTRRITSPSYSPSAIKPLAVITPAVFHQEDKVAEDFSSIAERNAVVALVGGILGCVPFKAHGM
jgi:hypothetical protein